MNSHPSVGKTTLLRDLVLTAAQKNLSAINSSNEINSVTAPQEAQSDASEEE